jgi:hypothetical protein
LQFDVTITVGPRPLVKAVLELLAPFLAGVPGVYPLGVAGALDSGVSIDDVTADVRGTAPGGCELVVTANAHLFGSVLATAHRTVGFNALTDLTHLGPVQLPVGNVVPLPLGAGSGGGERGIPLTLTAHVPLTLVGPTSTTDQELWLVPGVPTVTATAPAVADVAAFLTTAQDRLLAQLQAALGAATVVTLPSSAAGGPLAGIVADLHSGAVKRLTDVLRTVPAVSLGRVIAPTAGASCLTALVPTAGSARLEARSATNFHLQLGLMLGTRTGGDTFAPATPSPTALDVQISNPAVLALLCCMLESLPNLGLPDSHTTGADTDSPLCCRWIGATVNLGPVAFTGVALDLCIEPRTGSSKVITLRGHAQQMVSIVAEATVDFSTDITVDLNHLGELATTQTPMVSATASLSQGFVFGAILTTMPFIGPWVEGSALALQGVVNSQLNALLQTVFQPLKTLSTPAVVPPGLLDLFGGLTSQAVTLDDLEVEAVAWARPGLRTYRPRVKPDRPPVGPRQPGTTVPPVTPTPGTTTGNHGTTTGTTTAGTTATARPKRKAAAKPTSAAD